MQQRDNENRLSQEYTNTVLLKWVLYKPQKWWPYLVSVLGFFVVVGFVLFGIQIRYGLGVTGLARTNLLGTLYYNFRFLGWYFSAAGIMISAILRLTQAEWRRPVTRAAEITIFSLATALFSLLFTQEEHGE